MRKMKPACLCSVALLFLFMIVPRSLQAEVSISSVWITLSGTVLCDSSDQLNEILTAQQRSFAAGRKVLTRYTQTKSTYARHGSACDEYYFGRTIKVRIVTAIQPSYAGVFINTGQKRTFHIMEVRYFGFRGPDTRGFIVTLDSIEQLRQKMIRNHLLSGSDA